MKLHTIKLAKGARRGEKRLGRGMGSGLGKTSGRGHKGQRARSGGGKTPAHFEGGQMPLARRLPKIGFNNKRFRQEYAVVNLDTIAGLDLQGEVTQEALTQRGITKSTAPLKVLGRGEVTRPMTIHAAKFSKSAIEKIEKAGGKAVIV